MKQICTFFAVLMMAMLLPQGANAYDFSAVAPSGQTLYYNISNGSASVTYPNSSSLYPYMAYTGYAQPVGSLVFPDSVICGGTTYAVTSIGDWAFDGCTGLISVAIPNSVTSIGEWTFSGCIGLTSVIIGDGVTSIGQYAFQGCYSINSLTLGQSLLSYGIHAFSDVNNVETLIYNCPVNILANLEKSSLTSVSIGGNATTIYGNTFENCSNLTSVTIGSGVTYIGSSAFKNCIGLTSVMFNAHNCTSAGASSSDKRAFYGCSNVTSFIFGDGVRVIPDYLCCGMTNLTAVTIPDSVTSIGSAAFSGCTGLASVTIPDEVTFIGNAFSGCSGLTSVVFNAHNCASTVESAFHGCTNVTSFTFGDSVKVIPRYLCYGMTNLTSVTIPSSVTVIGLSAFSKCIRLASITVASGNTHYDSRNNCNAIIATDTNTLVCGCRSTIVPNSVTSIGDEAFYGCTNLTSVNIPNSVTSIGRYAFYACSRLSSITIPNSVTTIGDYAFYKCTGMASVTIGNSVTLIGDATFCDCSHLISLIIGSNVTEIRGRAFLRCYNLSKIHSLNEVAPLLGTIGGQGAFDGVPSTVRVYIPCGSSASYYSRWGFQNIIEEKAFTATSDNEQMGTVQILTMPTCTSPQAVVYASANSGYHFDHWSTGGTENPYTLTVTTDTTITAYFVSSGGGTEGIDDIVSSDVKVYVTAGRVHVIIEGRPADEFKVYDMMGRNVSNESLSAGVFLVKIGDLPARKVVVIR